MGNSVAPISAPSTAGGKKSPGRASRVTSVARSTGRISDKKGNRNTSSGARGLRRGSKDFRPGRQASEDEVKFAVQMLVRR